MLKGKVVVGKKNMNEPVLYRNLAADKDYKDIMKEQNIWIFSNTTSKNMMESWSIKH